MVYRARNRGRDIAVKTIHPEFARSREFRERFRHEVGSLRQVRSAHVPRFVGADTRAEVPWLATELVRGPSLGRRLRSGPLSGKELTILAAGALAALRDLHAQGVMHRDLKPGNVILAPDGPKVVDFGIARALDGTALTRAGGVVGSPGWIAPERHTHGLSTPAADVFAWGALVAFAATGRPPFGQGTPPVVVARVLGSEPDLTGVPDHLRALVGAALVKEVDRRPPAGWLLDRLSERDAGAREWLAESRKPKRRVGVAVGAALVALSLVAVGMSVALPWASPDDEGEATGESVEAGASNEAEEEPEPSVGARERGTNLGYVTLAEATTEELAENGSSSGIDRGQWGKFLLDPGPVSASVIFEGISRGDQGVSIPVTVFAGPDHTITREWFSVVTEQGGIRPVAIDGGEDLETDGRLIFMDAPERGLIVFASPDHEENVRGYPPVGLCYDAAGGEFSTRYDDCV